MDNYLLNIYNTISPVLLPVLFREAYFLSEQTANSELRISNSRMLRSELDMDVASPRPSEHYGRGG